MKKTIGLLIIFISVAIFQQTFAQTSVFNLDREINLFGDESSINDIKLNVNENVESISLVINAKIKMGDLKIEIFDPNNNNIGEFSIDSIITKDKKVSAEDEFNSEIVTGQIQKLIDKPIVGKYKVRIYPLKVYGNVKISAQFNSRI